MSNQTKQLSRTIVNQIIATNNPQLIEDVAKALTEKLSASQVVVEHVAQLTPVQKQNLESQVKTTFPEASKVTFKLNQDLIGGIRVTYQDRMYDDSLLGKLEILQNELLETTAPRAND